MIAASCVLVMLSHACPSDPGAALLRLLCSLADLRLGHSPELTQSTAQLVGDPEHPALDVDAEPPQGLAAVRARQRIRHLQLQTELPGVLGREHSQTLLVRPRPRGPFLSPLSYPPFHIG